MASLCVIARHEAIQWVTETPIAPLDGFVVPPRKDAKR